MPFESRFRSTARPILGGAARLTWQARVGCLVVIVASHALVSCGPPRVSREEVVALSRELSGNGPGADEAAEKLSTYADWAGRDDLGRSDLRAWLVRFATPAFVSGLRSQSQKTRVASAYGIRQLAPEAVAAIDPLIDAIDRNDEPVMELAVEALGAFGAKARSASDRIGNLLLLRNASLARAAARALGAIGGEEALHAALRSSERGARLAALYGVGTLKTAGPETMALVMTLAGDSDDTVSLLAVQVIGAVGGGRECIRLLRHIATSGAAESVRVYSIYSLGMIGRSEPRVVDDLRILLAERSAALRSAAARACGEFGATARVLLPVLEKMASDPGETTEVRGVAAGAIRRITAN